MAFTSPEASCNEFVAAFNAGDRAALLDFYEPDAVLIVEPGNEAAGIAAITAVIEGFLGTGGMLTMTADYAHASGDTALTGSTWSLAGKDADGKAVAMGGAKTAEVMRKQPDGSWRYIIDNAVAG